MNPRSSTGIAPQLSERGTGVAVEDMFCSAFRTLQQSGPCTCHWRITTMDLTWSQTASYVFASVLLVAAMLLMYPMQLILVHTLIETPFQDPDASRAAVYAPAPTKDDFDLPEDPVDVPQTVSSDTEGPRAIHSMQTRSFLSAWRNLQSAGLKGLFRAVSAQIIYALVYQSLFLLFGGLHPVMQLMNRIQSEDPADIKFSFSPILLVLMVLLKVAMIPLGLVVTRQIIGKPDGTSWVGHLRILISSVGIKSMLPLVLPQVLRSGVPLLLQNLSTFLHFLYLQETVVEPGWYAFFAILELAWQLFSAVFIVIPLEAVLYRAQTSVIAHMPNFDAFVGFPTSYISPIAELKQIIEEEMYISNTWYGRYFRSFRVIVVSTIMLFVVLLVAIIPVALTGALGAAK